MFSSSRTPLGWKPAYEGLFGSTFRLVLPALLVPQLFAAPPRLDPDTYLADPRLEITLWASEPAVVDPVAICFDAMGRAYVAECRDYPYGVGPEGGVGSTVRLLEDTNHDGQADRSVVFAEGLSFVTGLTPWRDGILVAAAPDILFLKDTTGDGVADVRQVVLTGFRLGVSDSLVNSLRFHLDNSIHGANGGSGGRIHSKNNPEQMLDLRYDDFAFQPDTGTVWLTGASGGGFGLVFDDWGRFFTTYNIDHIQHRFVTRAQISRFPGFPPTDLTHSISDHGEMARIFPVSEAQTRPNHPEQAGHFSSAGGMGVVGSSVWPKDLQGSLFVCDVVGNLVHRDVLLPLGPVFTATRTPEEMDREFFASRDNHFRPVGVENGPDGALYLLDMQREVIEHPDYIPPKMRETQDIRAGQDRGRIYRITPRGGLPVVPVRLGTTDASNWVSTLEHPDTWWRLTAQRLLIENRPLDQVPQLQRLLTRSTSPLGRLHALWTLAGLNQLKIDSLIGALNDPHPGVRENALQIAETHFLDRERLTDAVLQRVLDPVHRVRFQATLAMGSRSSEKAGAQWVDLLERDAAFPWSRRALWSSLAPQNQRQLAEKLLEHNGFRQATVPGAAETWKELADLIGARSGIQEEDLGWLISQIRIDIPSTTRTAWIEGLADGLARSGTKPTLDETLQEPLLRLFTLLDRKEWRPLWRLATVLNLPQSSAQTAALQTAQDLAGNRSLALAERLEAIGLLEFASPGSSRPILLELLDSTEPSAIQARAFEILRRGTDPEVGIRLVQLFPALTPSLRGPALQLLLDRRSYHEPLMAAIESGALTLGELNLDLEQRRRLLRESSADIRSRAARFFSDDDYANRNEIVDTWMQQLPKTGNAARGRSYFLESCAKCHRVGSDGYHVGPDLSGMSHRSVEDLLSNILDPNMAINPAYVVYEAEMQDGEVHYGLLAAETPEAITLLQAMEERVVLSRGQLIQLRSTGRSLMPDGLEMDRSPQDMRDLIEYLQSPIGSLPGE